jgi:hypothetical protein
MEGGREVRRSRGVGNVRWALVWLVESVTRPRGLKYHTRSVMGFAV